MKFTCRHCGNAIEMITWEGMITFSHIDAIMPSGHIFTCPDGENLAHPTMRALESLKLMIVMETYFLEKETAR